MIKVYTFANKRPDFVPLQLESFGRHLHEDYEFTVFNNAVFGPDRCNYDLIKSYGAIDVELDAEMVAKYKDYE